MARRFLNKKKASKRKPVAETTPVRDKALSSDDQDGAVSGKKSALQDRAEQEQAGIGHVTKNLTEKDTSTVMAPAEHAAARISEADYVDVKEKLPNADQLKTEQTREESITMANNGTVDMTMAPEVVAYRLLVDIMEAEGRSLAGVRDGSKRLTRGMLLDAYSECLETVQGNRPSMKK